MEILELLEAKKLEALELLEKELENYKIDYEEVKQVIDRLKTLQISLILLSGNLSYTNLNRMSNRNYNINSSTLKQAVEKWSVFKGPKTHTSRLHSIHTTGNLMNSLQRIGHKTDEASTLNKIPIYIIFYCGNWYCEETIIKKIFNNHYNSNTPRGNFDIPYALEKMNYNKISYLRTIHHIFKDAEFLSRFIENSTLNMDLIKKDSVDFPLF
jgi:hypothetical protein